jgi:ribosomal protein S18 acetylase RimI-like enzyme
LGGSSYLMNIVPASLLDLADLRSLEAICFPQDAWPILDLIAVLTLPGVIRLKAVQDGKMVGFIAGDVRHEIGWIATVAVLPAYRQHGIGARLLELCEESMNTARFRLCVRLDNENAMRLYRRHGYSNFETWFNYYNDGSSALVMEKQRQM